MKGHLVASLLLLSLVSFFSTANAEKCTDSETTYANSVWATAAVTPACLPYVTQTEPVYVNAPCSATDCVVVVEGVAESLPDCTYSGINNKIEVQNALTSCNGGDTEDAGSLIVTTDAPESTSEVDSSSSSSLTPTSTASTTSCTTTEEKSMLDLFTTVAKSAECTADSSINSSSVDISTLCASYCSDKVAYLAEDLPDCYYDYMDSNIKAYVMEEVEKCINVTASISVTFYPDSSPSSASSGASSEGPSPISSQASSGDLPPSTTADSSSSMTVKPNVLVISTLMGIVMGYR